MNRREIVICRDSADLCRQAADRFIGLARDGINERGRFAVALSGGSTPRGLYALLGAPEYRGEVAWSKVHLFWGDERSVPPDHADSNYRMVREVLLSQVDIPPEHVHRMAGEKDESTAAGEYEALLRDFFQLAGHNLPRFDLILLGVGEDGHTASLFPGAGALNETERLVTNTYVAKLDSERLTLTLPVLNNAAEILFLVTGESKKNVVAEILEARPGSPILPAARVQPSEGRVTWLISRDAASRLPRNGIDGS